MPVKKISPQDVFLARIMEERTSAVRNNAKDTIRHAQEHVHRAEAIVLQSITAIERAEKILEDVRKKKKHRLEEINNPADR